MQVNDSFEWQCQGYMEKYGWRHVVLNVEEITSWCAPPRLEVSVSFTDEEEDVMREKGYTADQSELGNVYYPAEGVSRAEKVSVNYVEYPWITCFEVEGLDIIKKWLENMVAGNSNSN